MWKYPLIQYFIQCYFRLLLIFPPSLYFKLDILQVKSWLYLLEECFAKIIVLLPLCTDSGIILLFIRHTLHSYELRVRIVKPWFIFGLSSESPHAHLVSLCYNNTMLRHCGAQGFRAYKPKIFLGLVWLFWLTWLTPILIWLVVYLYTLIVVLIEPIIIC